MMGGSRLDVLHRLKRLRTRLTARSPLALRPRSPIVSFTFDDFPRSAATTGREILERRGWRATYFASVGLMGGSTVHGSMFDARDLQRLAAEGHEIGCHTFSHADVTRSSSEQLAAEVRRNAEALGALGLGTRPSVFAFPYGEASPRSKELLIGRFRALRGIRPGINHGIVDAALLRAVPIDGGIEGIARAEQWAHRLTHSPGWLIYFAHEVSESPSMYGCRPAELARICEAVAAVGATVLPMSEALDALTGDSVTA